ncbi:MAG: sorbosone dehydrogenase family protein [Terricaulis sp.]
MRVLITTLFALTLAACGDGHAGSNQFGANPTLPAPQSGMIPTIKTAPAIGWPANGAPQAPAGFTVTRYAEGLNHPRYPYLLPDGDVLVVESSTQAANGGGIQSWVANQVQQGAGALAASANRVTILRDANHDGVVDYKGAFISSGLNQPFGIAQLGAYIYVANTDGVVRFPYTPGATSVSGGQQILALPHRNGDNGHWTRTLAVAPDGQTLFVSVGSSSNIADHGMADERGRAAIWQFNPDGSNAHIFASGIRNGAGLEFNPRTDELWTSVNERDMLGDNLVPDYMTHVTPGGFYGWPYSYWGKHVDVRVKPQNPQLVATALEPDFALGAHTASLGLHFYRGQALPERYRNGAFVGQHGSWNRSVFSGYKVVFVPFGANGRPTGEIEDFLTGFLNDREQALGRPVGVSEDSTGAILVADDVGNIVWRVAPTAH